MPFIISKIKLYDCLPPNHAQVVIHLTDGLDGQYNEMKRRVEELKISGEDESMAGLLDCYGC